MIIIYREAGNAWKASAFGTYVVGNAEFVGRLYATRRQLVSHRAGGQDTMLTV